MSQTWESNLQTLERKPSHAFNAALAGPTDYVSSNYFIMITCPCNAYPLKPHFYIVKLGFTGVYMFSYFSSKTYIVGTR